jgi:hypothetical protein
MKVSDTVEAIIPEQEITNDEIIDYDDTTIEDTNKS